MNYAPSASCPLQPFRCGPLATDPILVGPLPPFNFPSRTPPACACPMQRLHSATLPRHSARLGSPAACPIQCLGVPSGPIRRSHSRAYQSIRFLASRPRLHCSHSHPALSGPVASYPLRPFLSASFPLADFPLLCSRSIASPSFRRVSSRIHCSRCDPLIVRATRRRSLSTAASPMLQRPSQRIPRLRGQPAHIEYRHALSPLPRSIAASLVLASRFPPRHHLGAPLPLVLCSPRAPPPIHPSSSPLPLRPAPSSSTRFLSKPSPKHCCPSGAPLSLRLLASPTRHPLSSRVVCVPRASHAAAPFLLLSIPMQDRYRDLDKIIEISISKVRPFLFPRAPS